MARLHDDWCLLFYPFGVVIWQDVSNMSCKGGMSPLCVAKVIKKLQLSQLLASHYVILDKICLNYARKPVFM
jgi:hypothetical protein